ncbi:hypothetical protein ACLKMH_06650 [Psychromonas sp. KJ10-10]|uniref:hypothetical protein n=1 Tax=Psychromonas sp. KJ10-10 TaxID=3391823 RepID=UPI0039B44FE6
MPYGHREEVIMSDFNITLSPSSLVGIEKENIKNTQTEEEVVTSVAKSEAITDDKEKRNKRY